MKHTNLPLTHTDFRPTYRPVGRGVRAWDCIRQPQNDAAAVVIVGHPELDNGEWSVRFAVSTDERGRVWVEDHAAGTLQPDELAAVVEMVEAIVEFWGAR